MIWCGIERHIKAKRMLRRARALPLPSSPSQRPNQNNDFQSNIDKFLSHTPATYAAAMRYMGTCIGRVNCRILFQLIFIHFHWCYLRSRYVCVAFERKSDICVCAPSTSPCLSHGESASPNTQYWFAQARSLCDCGKRMCTMTLPLEHWLIHSNSGNDGKIPSSYYSMRFNFE